MDEETKNKYIVIMFGVIALGYLGFLVAMRAESKKATQRIIDNGPNIAREIFDDLKETDTDVEG